MSDALEDAALALFEARHTSRPITAFPASWVPQTLAESYRLQDAVMRHEGAAGGWKVLAGGEGEPMCSPIPKSRYHDNAATLDQAGLMVFLSEVEVAVKLGRTLARKATPYTPEDAAAAIVSVHPALEMCASSFAEAAEAPSLLKMGDLQSNAAVIVGAPLTPPTTLDFASLPIELRYGGAAVAQTEQGASWQEIVAAIAWLANHAISRGLALNAGDVIITGARLKYPATGPLAIEAELAGMAPVQVTLR
ncbi:fumarylacetoacetate hydrolase family protein [Devosia sp.]|uniref:fumarylacetoacetate hydrolase family protein n=1 Tax=Devosia sp. TaxID=1871048 RepID=UPI002734E7D8|nr:fumarylacetoacetate hydrolase family protein [Devosia sp.]MDP2781282.1 fumarylacetoacetate hydrolase family protein [Devosia sp.]